MGAALVLVCRNRTKAEAAKRELTEATGNRDIELVIADLIVQREVRRAAQELLGCNGRLDVLINNAGTNFTGYAETEDGIERTMALNYFSPFLLTNLLLETLKASAPSRVVNVSSVSHFRARLDFDNLNGRGQMGIGGLGAYGRSKLSLVMFTYELSRRLTGTGVTSNCLHPGTVRTNIWSHAGAFSPLAWLASLFFPGPKQGAKTPIYLASSPEVEGISGKYFENCVPRPSSKESYDEAVASSLWDLSLRTTGLAPADRVPACYIRIFGLGKVQALQRPMVGLLFFPSAIQSDIELLRFDNAHFGGPADSFPLSADIVREVQQKCARGKRRLETEKM